MSPARLAWLAFAALAAALAVATLARWADALAFDGPLAYGEGAVAHEGQLVARGGDPYAPPPPGMFYGANYPPLAYVIAALGQPLGVFTPLRVAGVVAMLAVAITIAWRARASWPIALALASGFLAFFPVRVWGVLARADAVAVGLTALAIVLAGERWPRVVGAGALAALAVAAKPTALLPLGAVLAYLWWRERRVAWRVTLAFVVAAALILAASLTRFGASGMVRHLVSWNALPYDFANAVLVLIVAVVTMGAFVVIAARFGDGRMRAYLAGALALALLAGREGATINYVLDLGAAGCLALAPRLRIDRALLPTALAAQLAVAALAVAAGLFAATGGWGDRARLVLASQLPRNVPHLAEDSGVLLANAIEPEVDDLFLWARLVAAAAIVDEVTPRVRAGEFASVIAEVQLDALDQAPAYERQRWPEPLARAVLDAYRLDLAADHFYRYVPRRTLVRSP